MVTIGFQEMKREGLLMLEKSNEIVEFTFSSGNLCLDFANTIGDRPKKMPQDKLYTYEDLLSWSQQTQILNEEEVEDLLALAESQPTQANQSLVYAKQIREVIYRIVSASFDETPASDEDLQTFNLALAETMAHIRLLPAETGFTWGWSSSYDNLERPLWSIVRSAADLLTSPEREWIRACASESCRWLFLDTSKNHTRRWCDMKSCGNRAKAHRHQLRTHLSQDASTQANKG